jgi:hypothetical protein
MAVERYVLGEMTAADRQAFEEHYFTCPECLEAVTFASDFLEVGHDYALRHTLEPAVAPDPAWHKRIFSTSWWFSPVPAFVSAVFLALFGLATYQGIELAQATKRLNTPRVVATSVFLPLAARGASDNAMGADLPTVTIDRNQAFELDFDLPQDRGQHPAYEGEIISKSASPGISTFSLPAEHLNQFSRVELAIPPTLFQGPYQLVIRGINDGAKEKTTIARYDFVLKFKN